MELASVCVHATVSASRVSVKLFSVRNPFKQYLELEQYLQKNESPISYNDDFLNICTEIVL